MCAVGSIVKKLIMGLVPGLLLLPVAPIQAEAAPKADLWERWLANQPSSRQTAIIYLTQGATMGRVGAWVRLRSAASLLCARSGYSGSGMEYL